MRERTKKRYKRYYKNFKEVKKYILLRLLIIFGISLVLSAGYTLFGAMKIKNGEILVIFVLIFLVVDIVFMRKNYYKLAHLRKYIMVEAIPHGIYTLVSVVTAGALPRSGIYEVLFGITHVFEFAIYNISPFVSAVIFNAMLLLAVRLVPLSMKWLHLSHG